MGTGRRRVHRRHPVPGHDELDARVTRAYDAFIGSGQYTLTGADDVTVHDDIAAFTVHLTEPGGEAAWTARVFLLIGPGDRLGA